MHNPITFKDGYVVAIQTSGSWWLSGRRVAWPWTAKALSASFFWISRPRARAPSSYSSEMLLSWA